MKPNEILNYNSGKITEQKSISNNTLVIEKKHEVDEAHLKLEQTNQMIAQLEEQIKKAKQNQETPQLVSKPISVVSVASTSSVELSVQDQINQIKAHTAELKAKTELQKKQTEALKAQKVKREEAEKKASKEA